MEKKLDDMIADLRLNGWGSEITESMEKLFRSIARHIDGAVEPQAPPAPAIEAPVATAQSGDPAF